MRLQRACSDLALVAMVFAMFSCTDVQPVKSQASSVERANSEVLEASGAVLRAFVARDGKSLAARVHPKKGVRFSSSAYVDMEKDIVFSAAQAAQFWKDRKIYAWGFVDGSGDAIELNPSTYAERHILDHDFLASSTVSVDSDRARGNTSNNAAAVYPQGTRVEYYFSPVSGKGVAEFDWAALRLVFEKADGVWLLVAVIHDQWSP